MTVRNWSNSSQFVDVPYPESLIDFKKRICIKAGVDPPLNLYYLGESKVLEAREKIDCDTVLKACLDKIANWKFSSDGIVPEILYHHGASPTTSPYSLLKGKGRPAAGAAAAAGTTTLLLLHRADPDSPHSVKESEEEI